MIPRRALLAVALVTACTSTTAHPEALAPHVHPVATHVPGWTFPASHVDNTFPADLVPRHDARCALVPQKPGWVARENTLRGITNWVPQTSASGDPVRMYVDDPSLACGNLLSLRLGAGGGKNVQVRVLRIGWYGGAGAREVWKSPAINVAPAFEPRVELRAHYVPACNWLTHVTTTVAPSWTPGLYLAEAMQGGKPVSAAAFVVRNDATPSPLVAVESNLTWAAYDGAGGASLYQGPSTPHSTHKMRFATRAYVVSMLRPTIGTGLVHVLAADVPLTQVAEQYGFAMDHVMDTDLAVRPSVLLGHAGIVLPGHSEYWTKRAYDAVRVERGRGVNLLVLGGNAMYWQARLLSDSSGRPLVLSVYRAASIDPETEIDPALTTVQWASDELRQPESALLGEAFAGAGAMGGMVVHNPPAWLVSRTSVRSGLVLPYAVMNEADGAKSADTSAPANVQVVLEGVLRGKPNVVVSSSYYSDPSGAAVFDAGVTRWPCIATNTCPERVVPEVTSLAVRELTIRLLWAFSHPRWGASHPSYRDVPVSAAALRTLLPVEAVGSYGHEKS